MAAVQSASSATNTWNNRSGIGKVAWSDKGNWNNYGNQLIPSNGDTLVFGFQQNQPSYTPTNDLSGLSLASILFNDTNRANSYNLIGNSIFLTGGVTNNAVNMQVISMGIILSNHVIFNPASNDLTVAGAISQTNGPWGINKTGANAVILSSSNSLAGGILINQGSVAASNNYSFGTGTVTFASNGTAVRALTNIQVANAFVFSNGVTGTFNVGAGLIMTNSGNISGAGSLLMTNSGTLLLSGSNNYSGGTTITSGTLKIGSANALGSITTSLINNGILDLGGFSVTGDTISGSGIISNCGGSIGCLAGG